MEDTEGAEDPEEKEGEKRMDWGDAITYARSLATFMEEKAQKPEDMKMLATLNTLCARLREMRVEQAVQSRIEHFFGRRQTVMGPFLSAGASSSTGSTGAASSGGNNTEEDSVSDSSSDDGSE